MTPAEEIQAVSPEVCVWQAYEPAVKCDLTSTALRFGDKLVLIDPIPLSASAARELASLGTPRLVICTSGNHARAADDFRKSYGIPIAAHPSARGELDFVVDQPIEPGMSPDGALEFIALPGAAEGEIAVYDQRGILCMGDALVHLPSTGLSLLPDKYCSDPKLLHKSLEKLLRLQFRILTFAHGLPLTTSAHERFAALLS